MIKFSEKVLKKLMDRIKNQRQEWMSKSMQEVPDSGVAMAMKPSQSSPGKSIGILLIPSTKLQN